MLVLLIPMPQKMEKASTKFSSFLVKGRSLNLLTNCEANKVGQLSTPLDSKGESVVGNTWITPMVYPSEFLMGMQRTVLWTKSVPSSTEGSNRVSL